MAYLQKELQQIVHARGFLPFDELMQIALTDPAKGYYCNKNPFAKEGDFTTAPQLSQVFGELIGLWLAEVWLIMGKPPRLNLVECGAGTGVLIADILRTTKKVEGFHQALSLNFIEINPHLIKLQQSALKEYSSMPKAWYNSVAALQLQEPTLIYANEFFDAMPLKQYCTINNKYYELGIISGTQGEPQLTFMQIKQLPKQALPCHLQENAIYETSPLANNILQQLMVLIKRVQGVILNVDYGYCTPSIVSSIRGFKSHKLLTVQEILQHITNTDITYNVNFCELQALGQKNNVDTYNILTQQEFLTTLGFSQRVNMLANNFKKQSEKELFLANNNKLISNKEMGEIFKVMAVSSGITLLPPFAKI